jgi:hypothetical protein
MTAAEHLLGRGLYRYMTHGLKAPSVGFNDAASTVATAILWNHWIITPALAIGFVLMGLRGSGSRSGMAWR